MDNAGDKIEAIQQWINEFQRRRAANPLESEQVLDEVFTLIQSVNSRRQGETVSQGTQARIAALTQANAVLQTQLAERETADAALRQAYIDLEGKLQERTAELSRVNRRLQAQMQEYQRTQALEREQRALTEALRDTVATLTSTLDLDKVLDHILDSVGRVTPYDGANVLFVESDLVHVVRQKGYVEAGREQDWLKQRIPIAKLGILQQMIDLGKPLATSDTTTSSAWIGFPDLDWIHSNVIAPIRLKDSILGFLSLDSATPGFFAQMHAERLQAFADQAAIAIQNARQ